MTRPESKPRFFIFRENDGKLKCKCWSLWHIEEEKIIAWEDEYWKGCELASKMNADEAAARDPQIALKI